MKEKNSRGKGGLAVRLCRVRVNVLASTGPWPFLTVLTVLEYFSKDSYTSQIGKLHRNTLNICKSSYIISTFKVGLRLKSSLVHVVVSMYLSPP